MQRILLVSLMLVAACGSKASNNTTGGTTGGTPIDQNYKLPPKPTATTAYVFASDFFSSSKVLAIDVSTRASGEVLGPDVLPLDGLIKAFGKRLYVIGRDFAGANNNLIALDPENDYKPACGSDAAACQIALGDKFNARDLWVVSEHQAFLTADILADGDNVGSMSNSVHVFDPITREKTGTIDIAAGAKALGSDLLAEIGDGTLDLEGLFSDGKHLFVIALMLQTQPEVGGFTPRAPKAIGNSCGFVPSVVVSVSLDTLQVDKVIRLRGSNALGGFVLEPGTDNLLVATPGATTVFTQEKCAGIERVNAKTLTYGGMAVTEAQLANGDPNGGTVFSFDLDSEGNGLAFVGLGDFNAPQYKLVRFKADQGLVAVIDDPGVDNLSYFGFISINASGDAYVSLPYTYPTPAGLAAYNVKTGAPLTNGSFALTLGAAGITFYPGFDFTR